MKIQKNLKLYTNKFGFVSNNNSKIFLTWQQSDNT